MCTIEKALQKSLNSFAMNCVPLSDKIVSGIPNLVKSSCKNLIVQLHVGILHFITISRKCQPLLNKIVPSLDLQNLYAALIMVAE